MNKIESILPSALSMKDNALLKGFAILCIILHNFCHWLPVCALENEYKFYVERTWTLLDFWSRGEHIVLNLFSYAGHYGVPLFLFLSGYGLVKKYEQGKLGYVDFWRFVFYNAKKLWWLLWLGLLLWFVSDLQLHGWHWIHSWKSVIYMVTYVVNLIPHQDQLLLLGPWWFFSLIMQLYVIYRLVLYRRGKMPLIIVTVVCMLLLLASVLVNDKQMQLLSYLRYNFVGSMLPFAMGIWMARYGVHYNWWQTTICLLLFVVCCFNKIAWLLSPFFFTLSCLPLVELKGKVRYALEWIGKLSSVIFVIHPIVRAYFINWIKDGGNWYVALLLYLIATFLVAIVYEKIIKRVPKARL